jgi:hypothetical protein
MRKARRRPTDAEARLRVEMGGDGKVPALAAVNIPLLSGGQTALPP